MLNISAQEYYLKEYGLDISKLPHNLGNAIGSNFLEGLISPKEELIEYFKDNNIPIDEEINNTGDCGIS